MFRSVRRGCMSCSQLVTTTGDICVVSLAALLSPSTGRSGGGHCRAGRRLPSGAEQCAGAGKLFLGCALATTSPVPLLLCVCVIVDSPLYLTLSLQVQLESISSRAFHDPCFVQQAMTIFSASHSQVKRPGTALWLLNV